MGRGVYGGVHEGESYHPSMKQALLSLGFAIAVLLLVARTSHAQVATPTPTATATATATATPTLTATPTGVGTPGPRSSPNAFGGPQPFGKGSMLGDNRGGFDDSNVANVLNAVNPQSSAFGGSQYPGQLYNSLSGEDASRYKELGGANCVSNVIQPAGTANPNSCLGTTTSGLTMTFATACVAYNFGYRSTCGLSSVTGPTGGSDCPGGNAIVFQDSSTTWVAMDENTTGSNSGLANFTRVTGTHYLIDSIDASRPTMPADAQLLMQVTTSGGSITNVADLRLMCGATSSAGLINIMDYGAKCDGKTDDSTAIMNAIDAACPSSGAGTGYSSETPCIRPILVPPPANLCCRIHTSLDMTMLQGLSFGGWPQGMGLGPSVICNDAGSTYYALDLAGSSYYHIHDLLISSQISGATYTGNGGRRGILVGRVGSTSNQAAQGTIDHVQVDFKGTTANLGGVLSVGIYLYGAEVTDPHDDQMAGDFPWVITTHNPVIISTAAPTSVPTPAAPPTRPSPTPTGSGSPTATPSVTPTPTASPTPYTLPSPIATPVAPPTASSLYQTLVSTSAGSTQNVHLNNDLGISTGYGPGLWADFAWYLTADNFYTLNVNPSDPNTNVSKFAIALSGGNSNLQMRNLVAEHWYSGMWVQGGLRHSNFYGEIQDTGNPTTGAVVSFDDNTSGGALNVFDNTFHIDPAGFTSGPLYTVENVWAQTFMNNTFDCDFNDTWCVNLVANSPAPNGCPGTGAAVAGPQSVCDTHVTGSGVNALGMVSIVAPSGSGFTLDLNGHNACSGFNVALGASDGVALIYAPCVNGGGEIFCQDLGSGGGNTQTAGPVGCSSVADYVIAVGVPGHFINWQQMR